MREHGPTSYHERRMHQACCYLLEHAAEDVSIEELAESLGYSYSRFRSVFKAQTGMPPRQYQLEIRINRAKDLLRESDQSMSEIADRLGFCSVYYFSRLFKQKTGVPPSLYRTRSVNGSMADSS
jgi:AraC-like DNA-binding protein